MREFGIESFFQNKDINILKSNLQKITEMNLFLRQIKINCKNLILDNDSTYAIIIKEDDLKTLDMANIHTMFETIKINRSSSYNEFRINNYLTVTNMSYNAEQNIAHYIKYTQSNKDAIYFIANKKIILITQGNQTDEEYLFITQEEINEYNLKPTIKEIDSVLAKYNQELNEDLSKIKSFFVDDITINKNSFSKNTLVHDHIGLMLISLSKYLSRNMKEDFQYGKVYDKDNLIYTEDDEGSIVLLEIHCFGTYLNFDGLTTTSYAHTELHSKIESITNFIDKTVNTIKKTIDLFKLVIFDARDEFIELDIERMIISNNLKNFSVYNSIRLINT